jgi:hypothetical protein
VKADVRQASDLKLIGRIALHVDNVSVKAYAYFLSGMKLLLSPIRCSFVPPAGQRCMAASRGAGCQQEDEAELSLPSSSLSRTSYDTCPSIAFDWHFVSGGSGSSSTQATGISSDKMSLDVEMDRLATALGPDTQGSAGDATCQ